MNLKRRSSKMPDFYSELRNHLRLALRDSACSDALHFATFELQTHVQA